MNDKKIIKKIKSKFRVLKDWTILFDNQSEYKGQIYFDEEDKRAVIHSWDYEGRTPKDFLLHEILHIVFIASNTKQKEELSVQDLCKILIKEV